MVAAAKKPKKEAADKPAKKKLKAVTGPLAVLDKPVSFGGVSIGKSTGRIGIGIDRSWIGLDEAADMFCNRRLIGKVVLGGADDASGQQKLVDDLDVEVNGAFDCKGFRVTEESLSTGLTFSLSEVSIADLAKFSKGVGRLVIMETGEIPDDAPSEDFDEEKPILKAEGPWADVELSTLFEGRILKALSKAGITTVGKLADHTQLHGEWWHKEVPGIGDAARQQIEDTLEKFWAANPQSDK